MNRLAKISINPNDSKKDNFSLALTDYFTREFKNNGLNVNNKKSSVHVALNGLYQDKYDTVIIDCQDGKMYLRGKDNNDKYFGRLSKFINGRPSDAYNCVNYNATRILNRINKVNEEISQYKMEREAMITVYDTRTKVMNTFAKQLINKLKDKFINKTAVTEPICPMPLYGLNVFDDREDTDESIRVYDIREMDELHNDPEYQEWCKERNDEAIDAIDRDYCEQINYPCSEKCHCDGHGHCHGHCHNKIARRRKKKKITRKQQH